MNRIFRLLFIMVSSIFLSVAAARLRLDELRGFVLRLEFADTLLTVKQRAEITRGIKMGLHMWESVLPDLHVIYADSSPVPEVTKIFRIGNYKNDRGLVPSGDAFKAPRGCPSTIQWLGCAPGGKIIYFNSRI